MKKIYVFILIFSFINLNVFAITYSGSAVLRTDRDTIKSNQPMTVNLIENFDSISITIPNLILLIDDPDYGTLEYAIGNLSISNSKPFNIRGISAIASTPILIQTEGDLIPQDGRPSYDWLATYLPDLPIELVALYDENDLIFTARISPFQEEERFFYIEFSTPNSNIPVIKGDVNRDGVVNSSDVTQLYRIINNL